MSSDLNEKLLTAKEVANFLGTSRRYVYLLIEQGTIKKVNLKGVIRIHPKELTKILEGKDG